MVRRLFVPDCHWPNIDINAYRLMLEVAVDFKPHEIIILGDWQDCYSVSRYDKHPQKMFLQLEEELVRGNEALTKMMLLLKPRHLFFIEGNHEARIQKYLQNFAPLLLTSIKKPEELLELPRNCTYLPYGQKNFLKLAPDFVACHGTLCGQTPAKRMLEKLGKSVIFGHTHKFQLHTRTTMDRENTAYNIGWLGNVDEAAEYIADVADWSHGFATGVFSKSGHWAINMHHIKNKQVIANNKQYVRGTKAAA